MSITSLNCAMEQANAAAAGANAVVPQVDVARVAGERVATVMVAGPMVDPAAAPVAAPVVGPLIAPMAAPVAVALFPQGVVPALFDVDGFLLGPLPTKSNGSCKILPKIAGETWP